MREVAIKFETYFGTDEVIDTPMGRIRLGNHVGRLVFSPEGQMKLIIPAKAVEDGSVIFTKEQ